MPAQKIIFGYYKAGILYTAAEFNMLLGGRFEIFKDQQHDVQP